MALEEQVVDRLIHLGYTVSFAESCTGGLCCGTLVNVANASKVLNASFVTYANAAKIRFLGVEADTILNYGVVSEQVAAQMARGVAKTTESDVASASPVLPVPAAAQLKSRWAWSVLALRAGSSADLYLPIWQFGSQPGARVCCEIRFFQIAGDFVRPAVRFCFCAGVAIFLLIFSAKYSIILAVLQRSTLC